MADLMLGLVLLSMVMIMLPIVMIVLPTVMLKMLGLVVLNKYTMIGIIKSCCFSYTLHCT